MPLTIATLTTDSGTTTLPMIEIPLTEEYVENASEVQTLDYNVYTDFINRKRIWTFTWTFLDQAKYDEIFAAYNSQYTTFKYPRLSVPYYGITNVPVRMTVNAKSVVNVTGGVEGMQITLRETAQQ